MSRADLQAAHDALTRHVTQLEHDLAAAVEARRTLTALIDGDQPDTSDLPGARDAGPEAGKPEATGSPLGYHDCQFCDRTFDSPQGKSLHERRAHPEVRFLTPDQRRLRAAGEDVT